MEQLTRLKARVATLSELGDIVVAMRALAASGLQDGRQAIDAVDHYATLVEKSIADVVEMLDAGGLVQDEDEGAEVLCIIGSQQGFVGDLNRVLIKVAEGQSPDRLVLVGARLEVEALEQQLTCAGLLPMVTHVSEVPALARRISEQLGNWRRIRLVMAQQDKGETATIFSRQVLPIALPPPSGRGGLPPLHQLSVRDLLFELAGEYLFAEISRALIEAMIEENQIRLHVLSAADENIRHKLDDLKRQTQLLRQETITSELLDVVTGAEAVSGNQSL